MNLNIIFNRKGQAAVLIVLLLLAVISAVSVGLITLTLRGMKMARNVTASAQAIAAANIGMEHVLKNKSIEDAKNCRLGNWEEVGDGIFYCLKQVDLPETATEKAWVSVGRSGDVRRAIFAPAPIGIDQYVRLIDREGHEDPSGHDPCKCRGVFGGNIREQPYAQTFLVGRTGELYKADIYIKITGGTLFGNNLRAEIRDIDESYLDPFYDLAKKPGPNVLASTTEFELVFDEGGQKYDISFNFNPSASVLQGDSYTLVVYRDGGTSAGIYWAACCTERRYLPGKGWRWASGPGDWVETLGMPPAQNELFNLVFAVYIFSPPGGEFGEIKP